MPHMGAHEIRECFLKFFEERGHSRVASSSLIPQNDPTLLFVNAGMVQFKNVFLDLERPYTRATSSQVCLRAGGKHNDLDNVGFTPRHQTLFEMLGNFSFGDYFKEDAIDFAWTFLTTVLKIPSERLVVSVYSGEGEKAPWDEEAYDLWKARLPEGRIYKCPAKENFWQMGDTGPCGPCTEIHIFNGSEAPLTAGQAGKGPEFEEDLYTEIWNLVFMQFDKQKDGTLEPLPKPCVDTGAGLERLSCVMAGAKSNYETELLKPLVDTAKELAGVSGPQEDEAPYQVIADHARATAFLMADGVTPGNGGPNYVLRRIMRRAIRFGEMAGISDLFFHKVCLEFVERFKGPYPQLLAARALIESQVTSEETTFRRTLRNGLKHFSDALAELESGTSEFPPSAAGKLKDTYGFPIDLTGVMAREKGLSLDEDAVAEWIKETQGSGGKGSLAGAGKGVADCYFHVANSLPDPGQFLGYDQTDAEGCELRAILSGSEQVQSAVKGEQVELVFDKTPFYAESGGQTFDCGTLSGDGISVEISDCQKPTGGAHFHTGRVLTGELKVGERYTLRVDTLRRDAIRRNHSATHLLHHVLREVLGEHVAQMGSLVEAERLRFDFSHGKPLTPQERQEIERRVADHVLDNKDTRTREMSLDDARETGAIGLFGENYGAEVRVVEVGPKSSELCGGTHVRRAGDIGLFAITSATGIGGGTRRIEAVTGTGALEHFHLLAETVGRASESLKAGDPGELLERIEKLQAQLKANSKEISELKGQLAAGGGSGGEDEIQEIEGVKLLAKRVPTAEPKILREAADTLRARLGSGVVVLAGEDDGKARLIVAVTKDLTKRVHAGKLVGSLASHVDGKGGGRPDLAQAGGPTVAGIDAAVAGAAAGLKAQLTS
ncbi:MAG: alanine--tRNA ligase [Planctomycetes bacterium]|nr:alanine--tRNA ligase [Planctomycetota bacterium]